MARPLRRLAEPRLLRPLATVLGITGIFILSLGLYPLIGEAYFPRTDPGQFVINVKAPTGTRLEITDQLVEQVEQIVREVVPTKDLKIIVSNIGVTPGFSSIYTPNSGPHTAFVQVGLKDGHRVEQLSNTWTACARGCKRNCRRSPPISKPAAWWTRF